MVFHIVITITKTSKPQAKDNRRMQELAVGNGEDFVEEVVVFAGDQYRCMAWRGTAKPGKEENRCIKYRGW